MNETPATESASVPVRKKRKLFLPIAGVMIAIAIAGFLASRAGLDKAIVKQKLDAFIVQMKENGRAQGRALDLTYGDLEVVGSFTNKHVLIRNPSFTIKPLEEVPVVAGAPTNSLIITTPELEIYPESVDLSSLRIQFAKPVNVAGMEAPEKSLLNITASSPIAVSIAQSTVAEVPRTRLHYTSPSQLTLTYLREQQAQGTEDASPTIVPVYETMQVAFDAGSVLDTDFSSDGSQLGKGSVNFKNIVMTPQSDPKAVLNLGTIQANWSNTLNDKKLNVMDAKLAFGPMAAAPELLPYAPISLALEARYEGAMLKTPEDVAMVQSQESAIQLKQFRLSTKDSTLSANADFTANTSDVLPVGTAKIQLTNTPFVLGEMRKYGILGAHNEALLEVVLQQITGVPMATLTDLDVAITRERGGSFKIGNTTFEELFATFLKQAVRPTEGKAAPVPQLPPADKVKAAPLPIPDNSVRG